MNPTIEIAPKGLGFAVSIPIEAVRLKADAIAAAGAVTQVTSAGEQEAAIAAVARLKGLSAGVEKAREAVKAPYWAAGKAIDAKAKEYAKELDENASAIERLIGEFQRQERAKAEAERQRQEQERREAEAAVERERQRAAEAARAAEKAEARRVEAARLAAEATGAAAKRKAEAAKAEADRLAAEAAQAALQAEIDAAEAEETANDANAIVYTPEAPKATGASIRETVEFEVTDIEAFAEWDRKRRAGNPKLPTFIKMEVKRADFKQYANIIPDAALDEIPGVTFTRSTKAAVRSAAPATDWPYSLPQ